MRVIAQDHMDLMHAGVEVVQQPLRVERPARARDGDDDSQVPRICRRASRAASRAIIALPSSWPLRRLCPCNFRRAHFRFRVQKPSNRFVNLLTAVLLTQWISLGKDQAVRVGHRSGAIDLDLHSLREEVRPRTAGIVGICDRQARRCLD